MKLKTKTCSHCGKTKLVNEYYNSQLKSGYAASCKTCLKTIRKKRFDSNPDYFKRRARDLRYQLDYGITLDDYEQLLTKQNNQCDICGTDTPVGGRENFAIDHDHSTGKIRGLLCNDCNLGLGSFQDNKESLKKAIQYLTND